MKRKRELKITPEIRAALLAHKARTKVGPTKLLDYKEMHPKGLTPGIVITWLEGRAKTAAKDHLDYVLSKWETLPACEFGYTPITDDFRKQILSYKEKTGLGAKRFLNNCKNVPVGLNAALLNNWLTGRVDSAREDHLSFVLDEWKMLAEQNPDRITLTPNLMQELEIYRDAKLLPGRVLDNSFDMPKGLKAYIISSWFSGRAKTAKARHVNFVLNRCRKMYSLKQHSPD